MKSILLAASILTLGAFATACGNSSSGPAAPSSAQAASPPAAASPVAASPQPAAAGLTPTVAIATAGKLGTILTDGHGATLYIFGKDTANHSNCTSDCAADWIPFTTNGGAPAAGPGTKATMLSTITRTDGSTQLTYNAHPLYYYSDDKKSPGSVEGQGSNEYGGLWYTVTPGGTPDSAKK